MVGKVLTVVAMLAAAPMTNAPADRYFGRLEMSTLRVRYETMQLRKRYESHELLPNQAEHLLDLTANAYYAWAAAYPHDTWLASTGFLIAQLYADLPGSVARARAVALYRFVAAHFSSTTYARKSRALLHRGIPLRRPPAWAVRTPAPSASPSSPPSALPATSATPSPPSA